MQRNIVQANRATGNILCDDIVIRNRLIGTDIITATSIVPKSITSEQLDDVVTPGSFTNANITVGSDGRITAAANGSSGAIVVEQPPTVAVVFSVAPPFSSPGIDMTNAPNVDLFLLKGDAAISTSGGTVIANVASFVFGFFCAVNAGGIGVVQEITVNNLWTPFFSAPVITTVPVNITVPLFGPIPNELPVTLADSNNHIVKGTIKPTPAQDGVIITFTPTFAGDWAATALVPMGITFQ